MDTRLVVDVVEALLKENDVDSQEGYCAVKQQVRGRRLLSFVFAVLVDLFQPRLSFFGSVVRFSSRVSDPLIYPNRWPLGSPSPSEFLPRLAFFAEMLRIPSYRLNPLRTTHSQMLVICSLSSLSTPLNN